MRISNNMMTYGFLSSLNKSMERENTLQEQLADGIAVRKPSDDPIKATRVVRYDTSLALNKQFTQNSQDAQSWMNTTDSTMSSVSSLMIKIKQLVVSADSTKTTSDLNVIGKQIDEMINQVVSLGNTQIGARYIFGGQNDATQPLVRTTIKDPNSGLTREVVEYNGDNGKISMPIQTGAANPSQDSVNITGEEAFGPLDTVYGQKTLDVLNHLLDIKNELMKTSNVSQTNAAGGIGTVSGTYSGDGFQDYAVRVDSTDTASGRVQGASYSTDGGNTWTAVGASGTNTSIDYTGNPAVLTLPNGITFKITDSTAAKSGDAYSFRVPQTAFTYNKSNTAGGDAVMTGVYTGTGKTSYTVKLTGLDSSGQVTGADYSTDGGSTWQSLSNYTLAQSNGSGGAATVTGTDTAHTYQMKIGSVDSDGKILTASYSTDGTTWTPATVAYNVNADSTTSATINMGGETMTVAANKNNAVGDTYTSTYSGGNITLNGGTSALKLPNGVVLNVDTASGNAIGDTYSFQVPQGTGPNTQWVSAVGLQEVDGDHAMQLKQQTALGVRMAMYQMATDMMATENTGIQTDISNNQDVDEAQALTDLNTAKTNYSAALAVGARIMQKSLVDFLTS